MTVFQLNWSKNAANDLRLIKNYIACDKPQIASKFIKKIKSKTERLKRFPLSGRVVPELPRSDVREIIVDNYRVIYKLISRNMFILTVFEVHKEFSLKQ